MSYNKDVMRKFDNFNFCLEKVIFKLGKVRCILRSINFIDFNVGNEKCILRLNIS